jgi:hypothetical protein
MKGTTLTKAYLCGAQCSPNIYAEKDVDGGEKKR